MKLLLLCLVAVQLVTSDLGFPFRIDPLLKIITSSIGLGVHPLQSGLIRLAIPNGIPFYANLSSAEKCKLYFVGNVSLAFQKTNQAILQTVSATSNPQKAFANLNNSLYDAERNLQKAYQLGSICGATFFGSNFSQLASDAVGDLKRLRNFVDGLRKSVSDASKIVPVSLESVQKYVTQGSINAFGDHLRKRTKSVESIAKLVQRFDQVIKQLLDTFLNFQKSLDSNFAPIETSIANLGGTLNVAVTTMNRTLINANSTIANNYSKVLSSGKLSDNLPVTEYLQFTSQTFEKMEFIPSQLVKHIQESATNASILFKGVIVKLLEINYSNIVTSLARTTADAIRINECTTNYPFFSGNLQILTQMGQNCIGKYPPVIPMINQVTGRLMTILTTLATSAVTELDTCLTFISETSCYENVLFYHFSEADSMYPGTTQITLMVMETAVVYANDALFSMDKCFGYLEGMMVKVFNETVDAFTSCLK